MLQQTPEQIAFIEELKSGQTSISLQAVAGSGKTWTLCQAIAAIAPKPSQCLALAFNKKIAMELERKLPRAVDCRTLNGLGHRAWGDHIKRKLFLNEYKIGGICSEVCKELGIGESWKELKELSIKAKDIGLAPSQVQGCIGIVEDTKENWSKIISQHNIENGESLIPPARKVLIKSISMALAGEIDFSDQLYMPAIYRARMPQYEIVLVDEAQDLSEIQHELIARCVKAGGRLIAVGDPSQAIYGFRGAASDSMEVLQVRFNSKPMTLSYTFRCPKVLVKMAQELVPQIKCPENTIEGQFANLGQAWEPKKLIPNSAILCRNIAPLVRLGFQCFRADVSAWLVGRDIGGPIIKASQELEGTSSKALHDSIRAWLGKRKLLANGDLQVIATAEDTAEALHFVVEASKATSPGDIDQQLRRLFSKDSGSLSLTTIHRAKGLEWDIVYLLDPWRIPAKFAREAQANDPEACGWMLDQEKNLKYIAITRARKALYFIEYEPGA